MKVIGPSVRAWVVLVPLSLGLAATAAWSAWVAPAVAGLALAFLLARSAPDATERLFLVLLAILLTGYATFGKSFAHLGVPPVYPGEVVLGVGLLAVVVGGWRPGPMIRSPILLLLIAFMAWGALRTAPFVPTYGLDALRDAVLWGYGVFALLLAPLLLKHRLLDRIVQVYGRVLPLIIVIAPVWAAISQAFQGDFTGGKPGDAGVHLGGAAAFLLAGLATKGGRPQRWSEWLLWSLLMLGLVIVGSWGRGGFLAALAAISVVLLCLPSKVGRRIMVTGAIGMLVAAVWMSTDLSLGIRDDRRIDPQQVVDNFKSIAGGTGAEVLDGTRRWRLLWWGAIVDYTIFGDYFWAGKGFGVNLAFDDGFEPFPNAPSRSPHNGHLTVLARTGVPGLLIWIVLQALFAMTMLRGVRQAKKRGEQARAAQYTWVLAYWLALLVNAAFDVYLEGPMGGIFFWCLMGYGVALITEDGQKARVPARSLSFVRPRRVATGVRALSARRSAL